MDSLQEFEEPAFKYKLTGILKKNIAGVLDAVIVFILANLVSYLLFADKDLSQYFSLINMGIYFFVILALYRLTTILLFTATIGMLLLGIQFMKESGSRLIVKEKVFAAFMIYVDGIRNYNLK